MRCCGWLSTGFLTLEPSAVPPMSDAELPDEESFAPPRKRGMRTGFTTGACATATAKAATRALLSQSRVGEVTISLPAGVDATFQIVTCEVGPDQCRCSVIKDAGDDPDVTHGAEICAS